MIEDTPGGPEVKSSPPNVGDAGLIPGWGTEIPHASWSKKQNIKQKQYGNKFNKYFEKKFMGTHISLWPVQVDVWLKTITIL